MRRLIMWNLMSLDGYIEGRGRDLSFHEDVWGEELERLSIEQGEEIGALLFGRVTYDLMAGYWPTAPKSAVADYMNGLPKFVFSRTLKNAEWTNSTLLKGDAAAEVAKLKQEKGKDIFVFGSADLSHPLIEANLFDEYRLCVTPVLLGEGTPLFNEGAGKRKLRLLETRPLKIGAVIVKYAPAN